MIVLFLIESTIIFSIGIMQNGMQEAIFTVLVIGIFTLWSILRDIKKAIERGAKNDSR